MDREQSSLFSPETSMEEVVNKIFTTDKEQNKFDKARRILGESADSLPDEKIESLVTDFELLVDNWLDVFEKRIFDGKTLKDVIGTSEDANTK